jgi:hypothetical protein
MEPAKPRPGVHRVTANLFRTGDGETVAGFGPGAADLIPQTIRYLTSNKPDSL